MKSVRARLLVWLLSAVVLGAFLGAGVTYRNVLRELDAQFDYQLRQMALSLRDQGFVSPEDAAAIADEQMDFIVQIWAADGARIYASRAPMGFPPQAVLGFSNMEAAGMNWRTFGVAARDRVIQVAQPAEIRRNLAAQAALRSVVPMFGIAPLLAAIIWWTVGVSLAPLRRVAKEVEQRSASALEPLGGSGSPAEIAPLVQAINALLERLRDSFCAQRAFVADAAHELRSPLTALKLQLGILERADTAAARRAAQDALSAGIERASRLVEQLLTLARNEPGATDIAQERVDLTEAARLGVADAVALADDRAVELSFHAAGPAPVLGDPAALRILVRNLVNNAVRYTPRGGSVEARLQTSGDRLELIVDDSGPGIPVAERERVFDRFFRRPVEEGSSDISGSGLGLAIVRTIADRHRASVSLLDSPLGGLRARVLFPPMS